MVGISNENAACSAKSLWKSTRKWRIFRLTAALDTGPSSSSVPLALHWQLFELRRRLRIDVRGRVTVWNLPSNPNQVAEEEGLRKERALLKVACTPRISELEFESYCRGAPKVNVELPRSKSSAFQVAPSESIGGENGFYLSRLRAKGYWYEMGG